MARSRGAGRWRDWLGGLFIAVGVGSSGAGLGWCGWSLIACKTTVKPNIILVITDDQNADTINGTMPNVQALAAEGITFTQAYVTTPICAPSRASTFTGYRATRHGVETNFHHLSFVPSTSIAVALQTQGYTTALIGKYINNYTQAIFGLTPPAGWNRWYAYFGPGNNLYYDYNINVDGTSVAKGSATADYSTDVWATEAVSFVSTATQPFFAYIAPHAPHHPAVGAPRHIGTFLGATCPTTDATMEANTDDKPQHIKDARADAPGDVFDTNCEWRNERRDALLAVDEMVDALVDAVAARGPTVLANTLFIYTSDNGLSNLDHWWQWKEVPYDASVRVPLVMRYDALFTTKNITRSEPILNIDLAPTLAGVAGATLPGRDGRDWIDYYRTPSIGWRTAFPMEYWDDTILATPTWTGVQTTAYKYVHYIDEFEEFYDRVTDALENENVAYLNPSDSRLPTARALHDTMH